MGIYIKPDATYVYRTLEQWRQLLDGKHRIIAEIERLRYYEDVIQLQEGESKTGTEVKIGLTAELIENVKAAVTANQPRAIFKPHRRGQAADDNSGKREKFWNEFLDWITHPDSVISEGADSAIGLSYGIWKLVKQPWPTDSRERKPRESAKSYLERLEPWKKKWGPPMRWVTVHPLSFFFNPSDTHIQECIEHSYKPKNAVYAKYHIGSDSDLNSRLVATMDGHPEQFVRPLPTGVDTSTMALVTEYWNPEWYQVYVNSRLIYEEENPTVTYLVVKGRTSGSKDPDKFAISVAENLRHNEPTINRNLTRMSEAAELIVKKRLTLELPDGSTDDVTVDMESGETRPRTITFREDVTEALPAGGKIVDPFAGVENVYQGLPLLQLLMQITAQHGVSPIFKGMPPGAAGSGYRDNSLYLMAKSQFSYIVDNIQYGIAQAIEWFEDLIVRDIKQEVWVGEFSLKTSDIEDWPVSITVELKPELPQNFIAEGEFWARMNATGLATKNRAREQGLGIEQPEEEDFGIILEQAQMAMIPILIQDAITTVLGRSEPTEEEQQQQQLEQGINPTMASRSRNPADGGSQMLFSNRNNNAPIGREGGRAVGGRTSAGQGRAPVFQPGGTEQQ